MAKVSTSWFLEAHKSESLLFWIVVRACRDIMTAHIPSNVYVGVDDYISAHDWIIENEPQNVVVELLDNGEALVKEMTFSDALEALGVSPENVSVLRNALVSGAGKMYDERAAVCLKTYQELCFHEHREHDPWWRAITNNIITPDKDW